MTYPAHEPPPPVDPGSGPYQQAPPGYAAYPPPPAYGVPYNHYPYGYAPPREHEGLAIASLVVSCAAVIGLCTWGLGGVLGIVGAILGHVARARLKHNGRAGAGLALAGIIVGWALAAISAVILVLVGVLFIRGGNTPDTTPV
jgi:Domain of unknown function (DUF4190)